MKKIEDKTTLKYLISLLGLFGISFTVLILIHIYFLNLVADLDKKTKNQESKIKISRYVMEDVAKIRSNFFEMSSGTSNEIGIKLFSKKIHKSMKDINRSLAILDKGGIVNRNIALNLVDKLSAKEQIAYIVDETQDNISIKELGLDAKLREVTNTIDGLIVSLQMRNLYLKEQNIKLVDVAKDVIRTNKSMPSFFNRINEDVNKIILNAELKLRETKAEIASKKKLYNYLELSLIIGTLLLSLIFALKIAKQIFKMNKILRRESKKLQAILDSTNNMVIVTDGEKINLGNDTFLDFFAYESLEAFSQKYDCVCELFLEHEDYFSLSMLQEGENWIEYMQKQRNTQKIVTMMNSNFEPKSFSVSIKENKREEYKYVISFADITDIKTESKKFEVMATYDSLTKIFNRQKFNEIFDYELKRKKRYGGDLSLIILDIDFFKKVNDTYGHDIGDNVLVNFANIVKDNIRIQDTFARWGGEEFVILLPKKDMESAMMVAEKLREIVEKNDKKKIPKITVSLGVTPIHSDDSQKSAFIRADEALYVAKKSGRNCVVSTGAYEPALSV
jgi:diguanylate cyclase (GGDEF)-like protein